MKQKIRNLVSDVVANSLITFGVVNKAKKNILQNDYIVSICFHYPSKTLFESCVNWLSENGFHFISVSDLEKISKGESSFRRGAVLITVDDGWKSNYENIVQVAQQKNIPVTIFINPEIVEKGNAYWWSYVHEAHKKGIPVQSNEYYKNLDNEEREKAIEELASKVSIGREALTIDQVKTISAGKVVSIESHTMSHPILPKCSDERSKYEIVESKKTIEQWLGKEVKHFAYPNGDCTDREVNTLKQNGYTTAFTVNQRYLSPADFSDMYRLPRIMMFENASFKENVCRMMGVWNKKRK